MGGDETLLPGESEGVEDLNDSISILERTRKQVAASVTNPRRKGHLLDKALAKQIINRRNELESSLVPAAVVLSDSGSLVPVAVVKSGSGNLVSDEELERPLLQKFFIDLEVTSPPQILPRHPLVRVSPARTQDEEFDEESLSVTSVSAQGSEINPSTMAEDLNKKIRKFERLGRIYNPEKYAVQTIKDNKKEWSSKMEEALMEVVEAAEELTLDEAAQEDLKAFARTAIENSEDMFQNFANSLSQKTSVDPSPSPGSSVTAASSPLADGEAVATSVPRESQQQAIKVAKVNVDIDSDIISSEAKALTAEIRKFEDWSSAESHEIELAMSKKEEWKKRLKSVKDKGWGIQRNTISFNLDQTKMMSSKATISVLEAELELVIENIEFEDEARCLYSLNKSKTADVKLPLFGGEFGEDYRKFEKEIKKGFRINRIRKDDQVPKLRENLKGQPKNLIPSTLTNIDEAFRILSSVYGDPVRVMEARKSKIASLGSFPKPGNKSASNIKAQVEWLMTLELTLKDIFDIGDENEDMYCEAYSPSMVRTVKNLFPLNILEEMTEFTGTAKDRLSALYKYIGVLRMKRQEIFKDLDSAEAPNSNTRDGSRAPTTAEPGKGKGKASYMVPNATATFNPPRRYEKCRICVTLDAEGNTFGLYEDHTADVASGCPRFAAMTTKDRCKYGQIAKLCHFCLDANFIYKRGTKHVNCPAFNRQQYFTCKADKCMKHFLVCMDHGRENKDKLDKCERFWSSKGKTFANPINVIGVSRDEPSNVQPTVDSEEPATSTDISPYATAQKDLIDASERLRKGAEGKVVLDVPEGEPLFLFSYVVGKTRALNTFYDRGCSHVMFKEGVPGGELDGIMTKKGPLKVNAAGDIVVTVNDEWACLVDKMDGTKQIMQGVTADRITTSFPFIKTGEALSEIVSKAPKHKRKLINSLKLPDMVGGEPDILLGILYESCHPTVVHTLPSGLFVAKLKLASNGNQYTGCIGGPHKSFASLAHKCGDTVRLLACFVEGLQDFKKFGPPKIKGPLMSLSEIEFAEEMSRVEVEEIVRSSGGVLSPKVLEFEKEVYALGPGEEAEVCEPTRGEEAAGDIFSVGVSLEEDPERVLDCSSCGDSFFASPDDNLHDVSESILEEECLRRFSGSSSLENLNDLKTLVKLQEQGISLEYRCPTCRRCSGCRNASETERISLREELEDDAIRQSVKIDFSKKKISAILPLRGEEEEYLSNNRVVALKVLRSQCKKVLKDEEAKKTVVKSFKKLLDNNYAVRLSDLPEDLMGQMLEKPVQHYLPWRVVYKESISTPCRTVMDASSRTPVTDEGKGGRCLNDLCMKGKVNTLNLLNMLLRFTVGSVACCGDLKQFYTSIQLDKSQWNLQRVLWLENMNIDSEPVELVIVSLIFGVRSVSALSERAVLDLAKFVKSSDPRLSEMLTKSRFVDDLADSDVDSSTIDALIRNADKLFTSAGLECKGWTISGKPPHPEVTSDGASVDVGGMVWLPELDSLTVKIPPIHFGRKERGKISVGTEIFQGTLADLKDFIPKNLTRRMIVSKYSAVFDPLGKLTPVTAEMKVHVRRAVKETSDWDDAVSEELRGLWIGNLWKLYSLQGLRFTRPRIPVDALSSKIQLVAAVDASSELKIAAVWGRFKRKNGLFSCQLIIGRSLIAREEGTIPKEELEALAMGSNLLWVVRKALEGWEHEYFLLSDSIISLCWTTSENKRLSLFHRNRCNQVRLNTDLQQLYHCRSEFNPSDLGTRPHQVTLESVGPDSPWEGGLDWMEKSIEEAVEEEVLKPAADLRLNDEDEREYGKGIIFEKTPEILIHGHSVNVSDRAKKMAERAEFSKYLIMPTRYSFDKIVRIVGLVFKFIRLTNNKRFQQVSNHRMFAMNDQTMGMSWGREKSSQRSSTLMVANVTERDLQNSLRYWYLKGSEEVEFFSKPETISKVAIKKEGILYSRSRIMEGQRLVEVGGLGGESLGSEVGFSLLTPVLDRYSPISMSIARLVHEKIGRHSGFETSYRLSLEYCHILQGAGLLRQIGEECSKCRRIRKKYIDVVMGPVSDYQLTLSPPFYTTFCDLDGPYQVYVPGHEKETRSRKVISAKCYLMMFACPVTKLVNLQVIEAKSAEAVLEGLTRLGCEQGFPHFLVLDQETSFMKAVREADINLKDLELKSFKEQGIRCEVAPVSGHNFNGLAERKIRTVQQCLDIMGLNNMRLHATGLQTLAKLAENNLNNLPLGYSYGRDSSNTPLLKIITPNMMKIGRLNSRSLDGPVKFPTGPKDMMKKVEECYTAFFKIWNVTMVPKLIPQPKWFKSTFEVVPEDVVYFQKSESNMSDKWTVGEVDSVIKSKDGVTRRAIVRYFNHGENIARYSDRAVRSLVKLFNIEDNYFIQDMADCEKLVSYLKGRTENRIKPTKIVRDPDGKFRVVGSNVAAKVVCACCCQGHCSLNQHGKGGRLSGVTYSDLEEREDGTEEMFIPYPVVPELSVEEEELGLGLGGGLGAKDEIFSMLTALQTKFDMVS